MKIKLLINILAAILLSLNTLANAQTTNEAKARTVVDNLYKAGNTKDIASWSKVELKKYFDTKLSDAIYQATHSEDGFDFDILYYAQDTKITNFKISGGSFNNSEYLASVSFKNFGEAKKISFTLNNAFKISEVKYDGQYLLTEIISGSNEED